MRLFVCISRSVCLSLWRVNISEEAGPQGCTSHPRVTARSRPKDTGTLKHSKVDLEQMNLPLNGPACHRAPVCFPGNVSGQHDHSGLDHKGIKTAVLEVLSVTIHQLRVSQRLI